MSASQPAYQRKDAEDGCRARAGARDSYTRGGGSAVTTTKRAGWDLGSASGVGSSLLPRELPVSRLSRCSA